MEPFDIVFSLFEPEGFSFMLQLLVVVLQLVYVLFSFMLTRQIKIMNRNFQTSLAGFFSLAATVNFLASIGLVAFSILAL